MADWRQGASPGPSQVRTLAKYHDRLPSPPPAPVRPPLRRRPSSSPVSTCSTHVCPVRPLLRSSLGRRAESKQRYAVH